MGPSTLLVVVQENGPDINPSAVALVTIVLETMVGNGFGPLFWSDKWLLGCSISELAPSIVAVIPLKIQKQQTVMEAMMNHEWSRDVQGGLSLTVLFEYFEL